MKRYLVLLAMLIPLLIFNLAIFSCKEDTEKNIIGTWVFEMTRADMVKEIIADDKEMSETLAESVIDMFFANITFPILVYKMVFTDTTFEAVSINAKNGLEMPAGSGTYTVEGSTVTLTGGREPMTGTIRGKKLTFRVDEEEMVLTKK